MAGEYSKLTTAEAAAELAGMMTPPGWEGHAGFSPWFWTTLGLFHVCWSTSDLLVDYAICRFLRISARDAHLITAGMMFGRKARLLADLVRRSEEPAKVEIGRCINGLRAIKRDIIVHGYMTAEKDGRITFIDRNSGGQAVAKSHTFTTEEFSQHAQKVWDLSNDLMAALGVDIKQLWAFSQAAFSRSSNSTSNEASRTDQE